MSKSRLLTLCFVMATVLSMPAPAGARGFGPLGVMRFAVTRLLAPGLVHRHGRHDRSHIREARAAPPESTPNPPAVPPSAGQLDAGKLLADPAARGQAAASAALALWSGDRHDGAAPWWSHGHGGYGWVGPLFWPLAYDDIYGYVIFGEAIGFRDYGYRDILAGIFAPYAAEDLAAYASQGRAHGAPARDDRKIPSMQELCGDAGRIAALPAEKIRQAIQPTEAQRAAFDDLAKASFAAAQLIQSSCPAQTASTAPERLSRMQARLDAMSKAVISLEWPLEKLYDALDAAQKARLDALAESRADAGNAAKSCETAQPLSWPTDEIESRLHPNAAQRAALDELKRASAYAADILNDECRPRDAATATAPGRLLAVDQRLHDMSQAVGRVSAALEDFYATLSDEQKAQFEAIGPKRTA
jgi:hypothetical protein